MIANYPSFLSTRVLVGVSSSGCARFWLYRLRCRYLIDLITDFWVPAVELRAAWLNPFIVCAIHYRFLLDLPPLCIFFFDAGKSTCFPTHFLHIQPLRTKNTAAIASVLPGLCGSVFVKFHVFGRFVALNVFLPLSLSSRLGM